MCIRDRFITAVREEWDMPRDGGRKRRLNDTVSTLRRCVRRHKERHKRSREQVAQDKGRRISTLWYVRICLSKPTLPVRTLENICRDFPVEETRLIKKDRIAYVRDAFVQLLKYLNRANIAYEMANIEVGIQSAENSPVFLLHVQDLRPWLCDNCCVQC